MQRLKQLIPKSASAHPQGAAAAAAAALTGRSFDVGGVRVNIHSVIAEGGFSTVYLAVNPANPSSPLALKRIAVRDEESLALVTREVTAMRALRSHPNVVQLVGHAVVDGASLGLRGKEALLLMELCGKSLAAVLEERAAEKKHFDETEAGVIFRDACNAVFALHCQSPPVAHRDLKTENLLLGTDGSWKLCDFGSVSTNHKIFDKPEEMGVEEDNIRKYTTPAYRAPEMWDLYRKEVINEKVDIWALGCLLYRICYLKLPFDGESKLQVLNLNYHIPDSPKYSSSVINLIKDMLQLAPEGRPDITQVWFRVNEILPLEVQKDLPDGLPANTKSSKTFTNDEASKKVPLVPDLSPTPPPLSNRKKDASPQDIPTLNTKQNQQRCVGAFWSSQYAQELSVEDAGPGFRQTPESKTLNASSSGSSINLFNDNSPGDFEIRFSPNGSEYGLEKVKPERPGNKSTVQTFGAFSTNFSSLGLDEHRTEDYLVAEVSRLKEELRTASHEKEAVRSKYEKLSAICSSQRQEIQELMQSVIANSVPPVNREPESNSNAELFNESAQTETPPREKIEGTLQDLEPTSVVEEAARPVAPRSVRTLRGQTSGRKLASTGLASTSAVAQSRKPDGATRQGKRSDAAQPAGWADF